MCCGHNGPQIGAPLEKSDLEAMPLAAQRFWNGFFSQAKLEIEDAKGRGEQQPLAPSQDLRADYFRAITEFDGAVYCPVHQLEIIFDFDPPN